MFLNLAKHPHCCSENVSSIEVDNDVKNQNGGIWHIPGWCHWPQSDLFMNKNTGVGPIAFTPQSHPLSPKPTWPPYEPSGSRKVRRKREWTQTSGGQHCPLFPPAAPWRMCGLFPDQGLNLHLLQWKRRGTTGCSQRSVLSLLSILVPWLQSVSSFVSPDTCLLHHFSSRSSNLSFLSFNGSFPPLPTKDKSFWRMNTWHSPFLPFS